MDLGTLLIFGGFAILLALFVNWYQRWTSKEPLESVDESRLCKETHVWKELLLLSPDDQEAYSNNPDAFSKRNMTTYCNKCGKVPSKNKMIRKKWLEEVQDIQASRDKAVQNEKDVQELKELWFKETIDHKRINNADVPMFKAGYDAYDSFVENLPKLVQAKQLQRVLEQVKSQSRAEP